MCIRGVGTARIALPTAVCAAALLALTAISPRAAPQDWPPFLRASDQYPAQIATAVRRLWTDATFTRTVSGDHAPVPLAFYLRFVDTPDVTAAAARHLRLTTYDVKAVGDDWYEVDNGSSTQGVYHVLARDGGERVLLSWGTHRGSVLGTLRGSALTRLEFADAGGRATQRLATSVIIDNGFAAGMTRPFLLLFGWLVDRKLNEAFRTAAAAAAWAHAKPDEFCAWLGGVVGDERRTEVLDVFKECVKG
jgi:hypothetical protein